MILALNLHPTKMGLIQAVMITVVMLLNVFQHVECNTGLLPSEFYDADLDNIEEHIAEMREMLQDRWELGIQQDICPWAECEYCDCYGERPRCSQQPPFMYRGPTKCKDKSASRPPGQCFFFGGKPSHDCKKQNREYGLCFPKSTIPIDQQICLMYTSDCENLVDFCNCSRVCTGLFNRLPTDPSTTSSPTTQLQSTVEQTVKPTAPPQTTIKTTDEVVMTTGVGNREGNSTDYGGGVEPNTTTLQEGTTVASLSPEIQDFGSGFQSMLSAMGILALVFGGLLLVCFVFIITVLCTCSCKRSPNRHHTFKHDMDQEHEKPEPHAYYYVDVDSNGTLTMSTEIPKGATKPNVANPVYNVTKVSSLGYRFTSNIPEDAYSEADATGIVVLTRESDEQLENLYAEVRPKSQAVSISLPTEAAAYEELEVEKQGHGNSEVAYMVLEDDGGASNSRSCSDLCSSTEYPFESSRSSGSSGSTLRESSGTPSDSEKGSSSGSRNNDSSRRSSLLSSADSGVHDHDDQKDNSGASSDFEEENSHYFEASTLPLPHRAKSSPSLSSGDGCQNDSLKRIPEVICEDSKDNAPKINTDNPLKANNLTCYEKLHCGKSSGRKFSIDSACSDNTYNALLSTGTLTLAEEDGKYSTLVREGKESKKKDIVDNSDSDNTYSELCRDNTDI